MWTEFSTTLPYIKQIIISLELFGAIHDCVINGVDFAGDKLKFTRSRSYREKSEKGNDDDTHNHKSLAHSASSPASAVPQRSRSHHSAPRPHSVIVTSSIPQPQSCIPSQPETSPETTEGVSVITLVSGVWYTINLLFN